MQWIKENETLRVGKKVYRYGETVPLDLIPNETVDRLKKECKLGAIPEAYDESKHLGVRIAELESSNKKYKDEVKDLKEEIKALKNPVKPDERKEKSK